MPNPYVFIVGCPRSGTTLVQRLVNAHPRIAIIPEAHWIYQLPEHRTGMTPDGMVDEKIVPALLEHPKFARLAINCDQLLALIGGNPRLAYSTFLRRVFDLYGRMQNKDLVGNKTPALVRRLEIVHNLWPEARIIHIIRDGRDVFLSMKNRPLRDRDVGARIVGAEDPVLTIGLWWELSVQMGRNAGKTLESLLYYEMRYETLVNRPREACTDLCAFLGVPYSDAMLRFYEGGKTRKDSQPITPGLRDWRTGMCAEDVEHFESAAGDLLEDLGYPRACPHPRRELVDRSRLKRGLLLGRSQRYTRAFKGGEVYS